MMNYHRIQKHTTFICLLLLPLLLLLLWTPTQTFADVQPTTGTVVVTLKPLYSLTAHLTEGVLTPELLVKQPPASHHHHLKPSERRLLAGANLIIWFGPTMEGYLQNIIEQQEESKSVTVVTALQADDIKLLNKRKKSSHQKPQHESQEGPQEESQEGPHQGIQQQNIDPHVWLSTYNAKTISKHIAQSLKIYDPKNTELYEKNLQLLLAKIKQTEGFIKTTLTTNTALTQQPFITYHDAFQYFENENKLSYIDSISYDEETGVSLKHMRHIKKLILKKKINCLVYQPPKPAIVNSLTMQTPIKATTLDPMALTSHKSTSGNGSNNNTSSNKNAWFSIMHQLATGFKECLTP